MKLRIHRYGGRKSLRVVRGDGAIFIDWQRYALEIRWREPKPL